MRNPAFQRRMALLALVAMLLLLALPTAGRVLAGASSSDSAWAQMCTMTGLKLVKIAPGDADPVPVSPLPAGEGGMAGEDCPYCPVLSAMVALLLWIVVAFPRVSNPSAHLRRTSRSPSFRHPSGLGSRGPPIPL